ncbi:ComF family protein [Brevibacillus fluminis]|uniref:ComF family protein n=1 Tax=Brevibacillus fluminis TaxID=511487 RepID=A0A3M8DWZ5_9BACL|nr:ComF family protein [Brevibacillus fluminis]RNB92656.1 ComF family protein [Brevibacillus fluminis]
MGDKMCLACNRSLVQKRLEETWTVLAQSLVPSNVYPRIYRLFGILPLCAGCLSELIILQGVHCIRCGRSLQNWVGQGELCGDCAYIEHDPLCCNRSLLRYDGWIKERIGTFKYRGDERWAHCFAVLMAIGYVRYYREAGISLISYVPLHEKRQWERGFNQAELLAIQLGRILRLPVKPLLLRTKETDKQSKQIGRLARQESMHDAFAMLPIPLTRVKKLLIVDDIYTTGSTLRSCAAAIHSAALPNATSKIDVCSLTLCR